MSKYPKKEDVIRLVEGERMWNSSVCSSSTFGTLKNVAITYCQPAGEGAEQRLHV